MIKRRKLKIKYEPGYHYATIDLTQSDEAVMADIKKLGRMLGWSDEDDKDPRNT